MFRRNRQEEAKFNGIVDKVLTELDEHVDEEEFNTHLEHLERLAAIRSAKERKPVSLDTMLTVGGYLLGILVIVAAEQNHVLNSKGMNFLPKPK